MDTNPGLMVIDVAAFIVRRQRFTPERLPVRNSEPRVQMDGRKWHLIWERDGGECWICNRHVAKGSGEIDHLVPRSSFEPKDIQLADRSDNLRVACVRCNQRKSNFTMFVLPRTLGVASRCWWCAATAELEVPDLLVKAYCGHCGIVSDVPDAGWLL